MLYISRVVDGKYGVVSTDYNRELLVNSHALLDMIFKAGKVVYGTIVSSRGVKVYPLLESSAAQVVEHGDYPELDVINDVFDKWILIGWMQDMAILSINRNKAVVALNVETKEQKLIANLKGNMFMPLGNFGVVGDYVVVLDKAVSMDGTEIRIFRYDSLSGDFVPTLSEDAGCASSYFRSAYGLNVCDKFVVIAVENKLFAFDTETEKLYRNTNLPKAVSDVFSIGEDINMAYTVEVLDSRVERVSDGATLYIRFIAKMRDNSDSTAAWRVYKRVRDNCWLSVRIYKDGRPMRVSGVCTNLSNPMDICE